MSPPLTYFAWRDAAAADLIERYGENSEIPKDLTEYVKARKFYDYKDHSREGAAHGEFVTDEIADRFSVIGDVDAVRAKLRELDSIGVDHFAGYLMHDDKEETMRVYSETVMPAIADSVTAKA